MARVKHAVASLKRRKRVLKQAKGYFGFKKRSYREAKQTLRNAMIYQFRDRKQRKRDFRKLWIVRINAAARQCGTNYSTLIAGMKKNNIEINRKMLSEIAIENMDHFKKIVELSSK